MRKRCRFSLLTVVIMVFGCTLGGCDQRTANDGSVAPASVSTVPTMLADLSRVRMENYTGAGKPAHEVVGVLNRVGTGGVLVVRTPYVGRLVHKEEVSPEYEGIDGIAVSPDGKRVAYGVKEKLKFRMVIDGRPGPIFDHVGDPQFTPDSRHVVYKADTGEKSFVVVDDKTSEPIHRIRGELHIAGEPERILLVEQRADGGDLEVVSYSLKLKRDLIAEIGAADVYFSRDFRRAAAIVAKGGKKTVVGFALAAPGKRSEGEPFDEVSNVTFDAASNHLMYVGKRGEQGFVVLDDQVAALPQSNVVELPVLNPVRKTVAVVLLSPDYVQLHQAFGKEPLTGPKYLYVSEAAYTADGARLVYAAEKEEAKRTRAFVVVNGKEADARFDKVVSPRFSPGGKFLVYRARQDGKRFLVVADPDGKTIAKHPAYEQVFAPTFTADGKSVAYAVKDGTQLLWKVEKLQ